MWSAISNITVLIVPLAFIVCMTAKSILSRFFAHREQMLRMELQRTAMLTGHDPMLFAEESETEDDSEDEPEAHEMEVYASGYSSRERQHSNE